MDDQYLCNNPARERHYAVPGARRISVALRVNWGDDDIRETTWKDIESFCSFACLKDWAAEKEQQHDGRFLKDGK